MSLGPGTTLGDYEIIREIGQGGMGRVYLARDAALDRNVAIKTIAPSHHDRDELVRRFQLEARAAAKLIHPNIVQIFKVDIEHDPPYLAMEFVDGQTVEQQVLSQGPMSWQRALNVVSQVASALVAAHAVGIVHRDIKLGNIMIEPNGRVKVTDFGLAKLMDSDLKLTRDTRAIGSPCYMSPEQCGIGEIGPASDIFSLGIAAFELMTGRLPFQADSAFEMMRKITSERIPSLRALNPAIPPIVEELIDHMAERQLEFRYPTAAELFEDIKALRAKEPLRHLNALKQKRGLHSGQTPRPPIDAPPPALTAGPPALVHTTPLSGLAEIGLGASAFSRPPQPVRAAWPASRLLIAAAALLLMLLVGFAGAFVALRFNAPRESGELAGPSSATVLPGAPQDGQRPPEAEVIYPRGLHPQHAPPADTRERSVWDSIYGPGGKFEGRSELTREEVAGLPEITEFGPPPRR